MQRPNDEKWLEILTLSRDHPNVIIGDVKLPSFPDPDIQIRTVGNAGPNALREAWQFSIDTTERFQSSRLFDGPDKKLLDFGCGWGRIARCFFRDFKPNLVLGVDVSKNLINICRESFNDTPFNLIEPLPPIPIPDCSIDFIVGYSVFSHLSEETCKAWIAEFARILKLGGRAALTTRGRFFFDYARNVVPDSEHKKIISTMFPDFDVAKQKYDRGEFVFSHAEWAAKTGVPDPHRYYGETFIPEEYARTAYSEILRLIEFFPDRGHPIMFFEKT